MIDKTEHEILKQAALIIKRELADQAPKPGDVDASGKVSIHRFGSFLIRRAKARQVNNPAAGGIVNVPERYSVRFSASKNWLHLLDDGTQTNA
jgi:hypothetical protein